MDHPSWCTNPQFRVRVDKKGELFASVEAPRTFPVNLKLIRGGERVSSAKEGDKKSVAVMTEARGEVFAAPLVAAVEPARPSTTRRVEASADKLRLQRDLAATRAKDDRRSAVGIRPLFFRRR